MRSSTAIVPGTIVIALLGGAVPARADPIDLSATATVTTDYRFRGISQSDRHPAVQASIDAAGGPGLYAGVWASTIDDRLAPGADAEVDIYAGLTRPLGTTGLRYGASLWGYFYPGAHHASYGEVQGELGYTLGPATARVFAAYAPDQRNTAQDNVYLGGALSGAIPHSPLSLELRGGWEDGFVHSKLDWQAELAWRRGPFRLSAAYVDTDVQHRAGLGRLAGSGLLGTLSVTL